VLVNKELATLLAFEPKLLNGFAHSRIVRVGVVIEEHQRFSALYRAMPNPRSQSRFPETDSYQNKESQLSQMTVDMREYGERAEPKR
jgi:hypothetical protein